VSRRKRARAAWALFPFHREDEKVELRNTTFIVTGASMGIGRALALELAGVGVNLVLNARHETPLKEAAHLCQAAGVRVEYQVGDAASAATCREATEKAARIGKFYGLVHAAGVVRPGPFLWELSEEHFHEIMAANILAAYQLIRSALPLLMEQGRGMVVFFGSGAAELTIPGIGAYCAAKAAEEHLARQLAVEAPSTTTFVYRPGMVETRLHEEAREVRQGGAAESLRSQFKSYQERGLLISPREAASALVRIMQDNPRRFHGRVCSWTDAP